jgi:hypothetical protein
MTKYIYKDCVEFTESCLLQMKPSSVWHVIAQDAQAHGEQLAFVKMLKNIMKETPEQTRKLLGYKLTVQLESIRMWVPAMTSQFTHFDWELYAKVQEARKSAVFTSSR